MYHTLIPSVLTLLMVAAMFRPDKNATHEFAFVPLVRFLWFIPIYVVWMVYLLIEHKLLSSH